MATPTPEESHAWIAQQFRENPEANARCYWNASAPIRREFGSFARYLAYFKATATGRARRHGGGHRGT